MMTQTGQRVARSERESLIAIDRQLVAISEIAVEIGKRPRDVYLRLLAADACERLGALDEAADHLATVLLTEPTHLDANRGMVRLLGKLGDTQGAIRCWQRVHAATAERDTEAVSILGAALSEGGEHESAIELLERLAAERPSDAGARANLAIALLAARREPEALTASRHALQLDPQSAGAHCALGLCHYEHGRWRAAAAAFRAAERSAPDSAAGPFNLGLALERLGEHEEARRALLRAAALEPHDEEIQAALEPLLARPSLVPSLDGRQQLAAIRGDLQSFDLLDVLEFLRSQQKTGCLVISAAPGIGMLRMEQGMLIGGSAPRLRRLGEVLVRRGLITREQLDRAQSHGDRCVAGEEGSAEADATSLARLLLRERAIEEGPLADILFRMTLHIVSQIKRWREAVFAFHPSPDTGFPIRFNVQRVVLELTRIEDEWLPRSERP